MSDLTSFFASKCIFYRMRLGLLPSIISITHDIFSISTWMTIHCLAGAITIHVLLICTRGRNRCFPLSLVSFRDS
ncbi:hypothetical protein BDV34DRAFT_154519 [Aspergillus parasiticus]|uniref:Uncharacterized protein n=1 Tax=Aspergillus parasiticus TaxID=5067 RepID=A0A5N6E1D9_ASPPA|nr:hypothetical protein BDV34DRAFT_154519 [Aspergillus parasiticus]